MVEQWKSVVGSAGGYIVSDQGRVQRVSSVGAPTKPLNPIITSKGYHLYSIRIQGQAKRMKAHRLVLDAFVGPEPSLWGLHTDDNPSNNALTNLRWGTKADNIADWRANGSRRKETPERTHCFNNHLLDDANVRIRITRHGQAFKACRTCIRAEKKASYERTTGKPT